MEVRDFTTLTFGLLNGWWRYNDPELRLEHAPLLDEKLWSKALVNAGFYSNYIFDKDMKDGSTLGQNVMIAQSNGVHTLEKTEIEIVKPTQVQEVVKSEQPVAKPVSNSISTRELEDIIIQSISSTLEIEEDLINCEQSFSEYGVDSITGVNLINQINDELGLVLKTTALFDYTNVTSLAEFIIENYSEELKLNNEVNESPNESKELVEISIEEEEDLDLALLEQLAEGNISTSEVLKNINYESVYK